MMRRLLRLALLLACLIPGAAQALTGDAAPQQHGFPVHLFPLLYADRDEGLPADELSALWPLVQIERDPGGEDRLAALRPLFSFGVADGGAHRFWDAVYPLAGGRDWHSPTSTDYLRRRWVLPVYFDLAGHSQDRDVRRTVYFPLLYKGSRQPHGGNYFILFPFYWNIEAGSSYFFPIYDPDAQRSLAFWPFWGRFRKLFGADELQFVLWPLWVDSYQGPNRTQTVLWPVFSRTRGPEVNAWRVWPLVAWKEKRDTGHRLTYLWPLGHHIRRQASGGKPGLDFDGFLPLFMKMKRGQYRLQYYFPFYGSAEQPGQKTQAWLWPLVTRTRHTDPDWTQTRILYFLVNIIRGDRPDEKTVVFPFFGDNDSPGRIWRFFAYPFIHDRKDEKQTGARFTRQYIFPFYINERWTDKDGALIKHRRALLPFFRSVKTGDGASESSWLHLWWYTELPGVLRNWAPLWTFYAARDDGHGTVERRVFWRLWRTRSVEGQGTEKEVNFLLGRYHRDLEGRAEWSALGFLHFGGGAEETIE
jgi:hypothetical protein